MGLISLTYNRLALPLYEKMKKETSLRDRDCQRRYSGFKRFLNKECLSNALNSKT